MANPMVLYLPIHIALLPEMRSDKGDQLQLHMHLSCPESAVEGR